jgi:RNA polymerase sigma-70 factor, ECF subfamily
MKKDSGVTRESSSSPINDLRVSREEAELSALMVQSQAGDAVSYVALLMKIKVLMTRYVGNSFVRLGMASFGGQEDVVQEILLAIHMKRGTFDSSQFFFPWMYAIARYKVIDHLRRNKIAIHSSVPLEDELENLATVMSDGMSSEMNIQTLFEGLPKKQREVLQLVKIEGLSVAEASKRTGYSPSDIKVTVHRAIKTLQKRTT